MRCFVKGEELITAGFENVKGEGVWIGLYPKGNVKNIETLPRFDEGKMSDWILTCGRRDNCDEWPAHGSIALTTDNLEYGEYVFAVSEWFYV